MTDQNKQNKKTIENKTIVEKIRPYMIFYLDVTLRGFFSFIVFSIIAFFLVNKFHINFIPVLIGCFILSILVSPFLSKIKIADKLITWYDKKLNNMFKEI